jgi:hypothetical protein
MMVPGWCMEVPLVRGVFLAAGAALVLNPSFATAQDRQKEEQEIIIPSSAMPPEGMCRVWLKDVPERSQPAATDCATAIKSRPRDALLLLGEPTKNAKMPTRRAPIAARGSVDDARSIRRGLNSLNGVDRSASVQRISGATQPPTQNAATRPAPGGAPSAVKAAEPAKAAVVAKPPQH